jgi:cystathionine beta-synthase
VFVNPDDRARDAIDKMHAHGISQLPVCKNEPPFAAAEVSGAVDELALMDSVFRDPSTMDMPVEKAMSPKLPTIGVGQKLSRAVEMLEHAPALLVLSGGRPLAVLSRTDVLSYLEAAANG